MNIFQHVQCRLLRLGGLGSAQAPAAGSGAEPQPKSNLVHFSLKIWHLVATNLTIFMRTKWPNFWHNFHILCRITAIRVQEVRGLNFHVEGLKTEVGLTTEVEGLSPRAPSLQPLCTCRQLYNRLYVLLCYDLLACWFALSDGLWIASPKRAVNL